LDQGLKLRQALESTDATLMATVHDALSAKLAEVAGYPTAILGSSTVANALLCMPDTGFLTLTEMEFVLARTAAACEIPIIVDADTAYGNAVNVVRTVRTLEAAGAAGMFFEDQEDPPRGGIDNLALVSVQEMAGKIKAAVDSRRSESFVVIARTDIWASEGLGAVMERGAAYIEAGADAFFAYAFLSEDEMRQVTGSVRARYHICSLRPDFPVAQLNSVGYHGVVVPRTLQAGAVASLQHLQEVRETGMFRDVPVEDLAPALSKGWPAFTGFDWVRELERRYMPFES
jgi:2-methylisocitrate lyase-like PEP mutase family enzyme